MEAGVMTFVTRYTHVHFIYGKKQHFNGFQSSEVPVLKYDLIVKLQVRTKHLLGGQFACVSIFPADSIDEESESKGFR